MDYGNKRQRVDTASANDDFVPLGIDNEQENRYSYGNQRIESSHARSGNVDRQHTRHRDARFDKRNAQDRPKSKYALPGQIHWVLVKTKLGRRFVHNTQTRESFWRIPKDLWPAVREYDALEEQQKEKAENARWAEEELKKMRTVPQKPEKEDEVEGDGQSSSRRRRSESLQREDEEAMLAELAAEAEGIGEAGTAEKVKTLQPVAGEVGYDSDGSYEYVEVTDSEGEEGAGDADSEKHEHENRNGHSNEEQLDEVHDSQIEFGEDDIAYQLAAMGEEYGLDPTEYGYDVDHPHEQGDGEDQPLAISEEDAANLFRDLLDDYRISPFTPWEKIIADESETSILNDDRYTVLPTMRARRAVFDTWVRDKAAQIKEERASMEKRDPKIPYLAFLARKATPKLYWPEFRRKYKREPELNERKLSDKDREKLYRDHISRLKLPESTRKADLLTLLKSIPLRYLNNATTLDSLPQQLVSHLHFISLPATVRDQLIRSHIATLPPPPEADDLSVEEQALAERKRADKRRREDALAERQRRVEEERRQAEKEERFAKREMREREEEIERAKAVGNRGLRDHLHEG